MATAISMEMAAMEFVKLSELGSGCNSGWGWNVGNLNEVLVPEQGEMGP